MLIINIYQDSQAFHLILLCFSRFICISHIFLIPSKSQTSLFFSDNLSKKKNKYQVKIELMSLLIDIYRDSQAVSISFSILIQYRFVSIWFSLRSPDFSAGNEQISTFCQNTKGLQSKVSILSQAFLMFDPAHSM